MFLRLPQSSMYTQPNAPHSFRNPAHSSTHKVPCGVCSLLLTQNNPLQVLECYCVISVTHHMQNFITDDRRNDKQPQLSLHRESRGCIRFRAAIPANWHMRGAHQCCNADIYLPLRTDRPERAFAELSQLFTRWQRWRCSAQRAQASEDRIHEMDCAAKR